MSGKIRASEIYGDGSFGSHYQVEPAIMQEIFEACLKDNLELLKYR